MKAVIKELRGSFPTLLRSKRGGVVASVLAAAGRTSTGQVDMGKALAAALRELPGNQQVPILTLSHPWPQFKRYVPYFRAFRTQAPQVFKVCSHKTFWASCMVATCFNTCKSHSWIRQPLLLKGSPPPNEFSLGSTALSPRQDPTY